MATVEECDQALHALADRLAATDAETRNRSALDRSLSCTLTDLDVVFGGQLRDGLLIDIRQVDSPNAQVQLRLSSDDLVALVDGTLKFAPAFASGRVKIDARVLDMIKLRSIF
jgi:alkyl sulfatase BDS1-like metallo-beta-lactamase superfamily hydrolase